MRRPALRYSLRAFLVASALIPVALYWFALPTLNAQRYAAAINSADYSAADKLCLDPSRKFPGDWTAHATFHPRATVAPLTWEDVKMGERQLYVGISYGDGQGLASCGLECRATRRGIKPGMFAP